MPCHFFSFSINDLLCQDQVDLKEEEEKTEVRSENRDAKGVVCWLGLSLEHFHSKQSWSPRATLLP